MSNLDNSVIICDPTPKKTRNKTTKRAKKTQKNEKRTFYENPLKHIQLSSKKWEQLQTQKRCIRSAALASNNAKNILSSEKDESLQDSIIILSDNESESNHKEDEKKSAHQARTGKRHLDISIDDIQSPSNTFNQSEVKVETPPRKRRRKSITTVFETNSSCFLVSDTEDSDITTIPLYDENTAPVSDTMNQGSDDIVVVWSSTKTAAQSEEQSKERTINQESNSKNSNSKAAAQSGEQLNEKIISQERNNKNSDTKGSVQAGKQLKGKTINQEKNNKNSNTKTLVQSGEKLKERTVYQEKNTKSPNTRALVQSGEQSNKTTVNEGEMNRIFMIDRTPNRENLSCLECSEEDISEQNEQPVTTNCAREIFEYLPFSKQDFKLPKPHNISKQIDMVKPQARSRLRDWRQQISHFCMALRNNTMVTTDASMVSVACSSKTVHESSKSYELSNTGVRADEYRPESPTSSPEPSDRHRLREIVIDGNNVAMAHTNGRSFSEQGIRMVIDYFKQRGHSVKVFVPQHRRSLNHRLLEKLHLEGTVIFTPSRNIAGRRITPYDDRYILEYATMCKGIVVSLDQYRDLYLEKPEWRDTIANRLLAPTFVGNIVMFPEDPLGRTGPTLDEFLKY